MGRVDEHLKVVILCAGKGTRLLPLTIDNPKCLVEINNVSILDYQIKAFSSKKCIDEIIIVTGYLSDLIISHVKSHHRGIKIRFIKNTIYNISNSLYSISLVNKVVKSETFIFLNGDLIFDEDIINELIESSSSVILFDNKLEYIDGEMNLELHKDMVTVKNVSKNLGPDLYHGRSLQITKIIKSDTVLFWDETKRLLKFKANVEKGFPTLALSQIINQKKLKSLIPYKNYNWVEIDTLFDYEYAQSIWRNTI